ncbi:sensor histidine kinase [Fibrisoma limi]|nr:histidine kinase [Fibrisoma limi]
MSFRSQASRNWFFRYKLYHLPFWFVYHYLWWVLTFGDPFKVIQTLAILPYTLKYSVYVVFQALAVYANLYVLIPRYLEKSRFGFYLAYWLLTVVCATLCIVGGYYFSAYVSHRSIQDLYGESARFYVFLGNALPSTVASMTLAMSIKLTKNWVQTRQRQQLLEKEKLETELKFLKNQFNPHFLFNTINSIFFLIHKNPDMASASLAKFSELLRYQLYECNDGPIPLKREITYLKNVMELEELRLNDNVRVTFDVELALAEQLGIAPFILMPFVENAFKHVSKQRDRLNWITIKLAVTGGQLDFRVANSTDSDAAREVVQYGGIGLKNVQRRLDLIYPDQYKLTIQHDPGQFTVTLRVMLAELTPSPTLQVV